MAPKRQRTSLLIVRTRHIVTARSAVVRDTRMFQHIAGCTDEIALAGGNDRHLRTVIVTAAVYRGLGSKLRPKANLSP
jgi:hypothetical protein